MSFENLPSITDWYVGQTLFITGASGFLGKVFLHKILKSCPGINTIYVLLRPKRGKTSKERLEELFSSSIFDEFKSHNPEVLTKVKMIEGDVAKPYLGIKESDWKMLQESVTIVFNAAASVRFDDTLQKAIFTNTRSAKHALLLAKGMKNLKAFVHVSTAFTNCNCAHIKEKVVPIDFDPGKLIEAAEKMDEHELEIFSRKIIGAFPNTYIFTKNIAEVLVDQERNNLPVIIYRPAIITSSVKEPEPGWCDTFNGLSAICYATGTGVLRVNLATKDNILDIITVDACVNGMIVGAWYRNIYLPISKKKTLEENIVFNATDLKLKQLYMTEYYMEVVNKNPFPNGLWAVKHFQTSSTLNFYLLSILLHVIPGMIVDGALKIAKKKPKLMKVYRKLHSTFLNLSPFTLNNWEFDTDNFQKLKEIIPQHEKSKFFVDSLFKTNLKGMLTSAANGFRKFLGIPAKASKKELERHNRLYWIDLILQLSFLGIFLWILPLKKTLDWSTDIFAGYQESFNKLEAEYQEYKAKMATTFS